MFSKQNPFLATIKERHLLSKEGTKKNTQHVVLDLSGSGFVYNVGDSIAVYPQNESVVVEQTLSAMRATGEEIIQERNSGNPYPLREFLTSKANISDFSRKFLSELAARQTNHDKKNLLESLLQEGNKDALKQYQLNHELWDLLLENQEARFSPQELCSLLMPLLPRLYSIASSMKAVGEEVHLTVALLKYTTNHYIRQGVCTQYLCYQAPLNEPVVPVYIQPHHGFTLPADPDASIIMIGPGTGVAPYRAFMQERMAVGSKGKNWLFFGEWNRAYDYFYEDYWTSLEAKGILKTSLAFSRDQEQKVYVQHKMLEQGEELFHWLEQGAYLFVCGDAHHMAKDVDKTLHQIVEKFGQMDDVSAKAYIKKLSQEKRYLRDVY